MHPWEDWAETWAHYLHMVDTLETARATASRCACPPRSRSASRSSTDSLAFRDFDSLTSSWNAVTLALNSLNRSMGMKDAYPFVLSPTVLEKLRFVHDLIQSRPRGTKIRRIFARPVEVPFPATHALRRGSHMRRLCSWPARSRPVAATAAADFKLNAQEYFERPGINVMYGQDYYPEGHQGGSASSCTTSASPRTATCASSLRPASGRRSRNPASARSTPPRRKSACRWLSRTRSAIARVSTPSIYPDLKLNYTVRARPEGESIRVSVDFDAPVPKDGWARSDSTSSSSPACCSASPINSARARRVPAPAQRAGRNPVLGARQTPRSRAGNRAVSPDDRSPCAAASSSCSTAAAITTTAGSSCARSRPRARPRRDRVAGDAARERGLDAHAGHPGLAGGLSPRAAEAGHHRARSARHERGRT